MSEVTAQLVSAGMSEEAAYAKQALHERCVTRLKAGADDTIGFFVPGRIEVLGKHTDYAGGRSLLCTLERGFVVAARPRADNLLRVTDVLRNQTRELALDPAAGGHTGDWSNYIATEARRVARNFPQARRGADIAFASDLPADSGMSSSSALMIALFQILGTINQLADDPGYRAHITSQEDLATYLACIENGQSFGDLAGDKGVGTMGGSEDHTAILCCTAGFLSQYTFCPVQFERKIAIPPELRFVIAFSGVAAAKTGGALARYNSAAETTQRILHTWNEATGHKDTTLASAIQCDEGAITRMRFVLSRSAPLLSRFNQFALENCHLIPRAGDALRSGELELFGELVDASQHAAETLLGNQIAETTFLARSARKSGAHAASAFGAGFGGSVWALVDADHARAFAAAWRNAYARQHPAVSARAEFIVTVCGPPATRLGETSG